MEARGLVVSSKEKKQGIIDDEEIDTHTYVKQHYHTVSSS